MFVETEYQEIMHFFLSFPHIHLFFTLFPHELFEVYTFCVCNRGQIFLYLYWCSADYLLAL